MFGLNSLIDIYDRQHCSEQLYAKYINESIYSLLVSIYSLFNENYFRYLKNEFRFFMLGEELNNRLEKHRNSGK